MRVFNICHNKDEYLRMSEPPTCYLVFGRKKTQKQTNIRIIIACCRIVIQKIAQNLLPQPWWGRKRSHGFSSHHCSIAERWNQTAVVCLAYHRFCIFWVNFLNDCLPWLEIMNSFFLLRHHLFAFVIAAFYLPLFRNFYVIITTLWNALLISLLPTIIICHK